MNSTVLTLTFWAFTTITAVFTTVARQYYGDAGFLDLLVLVGSVGLIVLWYQHDARERGLYTGDGKFELFVLFAAVIAIPVYLLKYRGWKDGGLALLKILGLAIASYSLAIGALLLLSSLGLF